MAVAQLSLAAIINKFPADLQKYVLAMPASGATVALPLSSIQKQLAGGAVKMSLASLFRQAPGGTFSEWKSEEKRMVEVPLSEVMRHVDVHSLKRRVDQRKVDLPTSAPRLFGDRKNPFAVAPVFEDDEEEPTPAAVEGLAPEEEDEEFAAPLFQRAAAPALVLPAPAPRPPAQTTRPLPVMLPPAAKGLFTLGLDALCAEWPEPVRSEAQAMHHAQVNLPPERVASGLSKGRVLVTWGELRSWITPAPSEPSEEAEQTELLLPLKVVAPAFMAFSGPAARRKSVQLDESIPALFGGAAAGASAPVLPNPPAEILPFAPAPVAPVSEPVPEIHFPEEPLFKLVPRLSEEPVLMPPLAMEPALEPASVAPAVEARPATPFSADASTLSALFGLPERTSWPAKELIERAAHLPGVAGALLALQEGLLVAASLPDEVKEDAAAAFLPQIFARLNNYMGEMQLAEVDDLLVTTGSRAFQAFRLGQVYFAVLGRPGEELPRHALRLVAQELKSQAPA